MATVPGARVAGIDLKGTLGTANTRRVAAWRRRRAV